MAESRHRRTYLVDRSFQLKYILLLMGWGVVLAALFSLWTHQAHLQALETIVRDPAQRVLIERADRQLLWALGAIGALSVAALGLLGFIMTHRVAGPVYVLAHYLTLLGRGRYPAHRALRRHDELKALNARFMDTIDALKERDARRLAHLEAAVARMRAATGRVPELAAVLPPLEEEIQERRAALADTQAATPTPAEAVVPG
jgi:hypothetical protein